MTVGYDKLSLNHQLLLGLTFEEMTGLVTHDRAKPAHPCTLRGVTLPVWGALANGLPYINFDPSVNVGWLDCPQADTVDLDFTNGDLSMAAWVYLVDLTFDRTIMNRGLGANDGWSFVFNAAHLPAVGDLEFRTSQLGDNQFSDCQPNATGLNAWYLVGAARSGTSVRIFSQGLDRTVPGIHTDPDTSNRKLHIGIYDDETNAPFYGGMWYPRIWGRRLADWEWLEMFNMERHWFGV